MKLIEKKPKYIILLLGFILVMGEMATDIFLPSLPSLKEHFNTTTSATQFTLASYMIGFAIMQLFYGPISDKYGRRNPLIISTCIFLISSLICSTSTSIYSLIFFRFIQSLGGAAGVTICLAIVRDLYDSTESTKMYAKIGIVIAIAPAIAPIIGGIIIYYTNWRWNFYALAIWSLVVLFLIIFFLPETIKKEHISVLTINKIITSCAELFKSSQYIGYVITLSFIFSAFFSFIFSAPFIFINLFGMSESLFPIVITVQVIGFIFGNSIVNFISIKFSKNKIFFYGVLISFISGLLVTFFPLIGIKTIITIVGPMTIFAFSVGLMFPLGTAGALSPFPHIAGLASAVLGFFQTLGGVLFGLLSGLIGDQSIMSMTLLIGVSTSLATVSYFYFLFRFKN